jgi:hypothetical protein
MPSPEFEYRPVPSVGVLFKILVLAIRIQFKKLVLTAHKTKINNVFFHQLEPHAEKYCTLTESYQMMKEIS